MVLLRRFVFSLLVLLPGVVHAETQPIAHVTIIDGDGQVSPTQWRSNSTWIWSQNHLLLQTAIEIPSHIADTLPPSMASFVRGSTFKGPFKLQDDHRFLILELRSPSQLFKLGAKDALRVNVDFDHTNWMRNANCRESNVALSEVEDGSETSASSVSVSASAKPDAFFISLFCRPARGGSWIEVAASEEVSLSFEPHGQIRFKTSPDGTEFWLPRGPHPRVLSDILVAGGSGEVTSRYELSAEPVVSERIPVRTAADDAEPLFFDVEGTSVASLPPSAERLPVIGVQGQLLDAHGSVTSANGLASAEVAVVARTSREFKFGSLGADLAIPIRRLGAGLDAKGAGSHFGYVNVGYEYQPSSRLMWTFGAQASVLDVHSPDRQSVYSLAPSVAANFGLLYSINVAPLDFVSNFFVARARADFPVTQDQKNRITLEALLGRTWIQPKNDSWNVNGVSLGFVGEF